MSKNAFWQALVFTVIVFSLGMILGYFLEVRQSESIYNDLISSELNLIDEQLRQKIIIDNNISCSLAKESLFSFADKIYEDALNVEELDTTGRINDLTVLHRRYDLLRTMLLVEAENLKQRCKGDFHIINYLYYYNMDDIEINSRQNYFSRLAFDFKTAYPEEVVLIPMAIDTNIASVDLFVKSLNLKNYPVIIVDGDKVITDVLTFEEFEKIVLK